MLKRRFDLVDSTSSLSEQDQMTTSSGTEAVASTDLSFKEPRVETQVSSDATEEAADALTTEKDPDQAPITATHALELAGRHHTAPTAVDRIQKKDFKLKEKKYLSFMIERYHEVKTQFGEDFFKNLDKIHLKDRYGLTPLHIAAFMNDKQLVDKLICHGASVHTLTSLGDDPSRMILKALGLSSRRYLELAGVKKLYGIVDVRFKAMLDTFLKQGVDIYQGFAQQKSFFHLLVGMNRWGQATIFSQSVQNLIQNISDTCIEYLFKQNKIPHIHQIIFKLEGYAQAKGFSFHKSLCKIQPQPPLRWVEKMLPSDACITSNFQLVEMAHQNFIIPHPHVIEMNQEDEIASPLLNQNDAAAHSLFSARSSQVTILRNLIPSIPQSSSTAALVEQSYESASLVQVQLAGSVQANDTAAYPLFSARSSQSTMLRHSIPSIPQSSSTAAASLVEQTDEAVAFVSASNTPSVDDQETAHDAELVQDAQMLLLFSKSQRHLSKQTHKLS